MEHPGKIWNCIETLVNKYLGHLLPPRSLRWLWELGYLALGVLALLHSLPACLGYLLCMEVYTENYCREEVFQADPAFVNPAHEGRLVRISGTLSSDSFVRDPLTGVQAKVPWLSRTRSQQQHAPLTEENAEWRMKLHGADVFYAPEWRLGAFRIHHYAPSYREDESAIPPHQLSYTPTDEGWQVTPPQEGESFPRLTTPEGILIDYLEYTTRTKPVHIIARQCGNSLLMTDPSAEFRYQPFVYVERAGFIFPVIPVLLLFQFGTLCLALSCFRAALWHITMGKNLLRLPLCQAVLFIQGILCCASCALFLLLCEPAHKSGLAQGLIFAASGLLLGLSAYHRWRRA